MLHEVGKYTQAQFYATSVKVDIVGQVEGVGRLDVNLLHLGTPTVIAKTGQKFSFTHNSRGTTYAFTNGNPSEVSSPGYLGGCGSGAAVITYAGRYLALLSYIYSTKVQITTTISIEAADCSWHSVSRDEAMRLSVGTGCSSGEDNYYIGLSPFTWWEMRLPGNFKYDKVIMYNHHPNHVVACDAMRLPTQYACCGLCTIMFDL